VKFQQSSALIVFTLIGLVMFAGVLSAHHSVAGYDTEKQVEQRGVIVEYNWRNPHVFVVWNVKDQSGKVVQWAGEMNSPTSMMQVGMNKNSLKVGDEVILTINPSKTGNPLGIIRKVTTPDGKIIVDRFTPQ
jgi:hypothetical protein